MTMLRGFRRHTVDHADLKKLKLAEARFQVCQDRVNLAAHGFQPESFAYPFSDFNSSHETQAIQYCGDNESTRQVIGGSYVTPFCC